MIGTERASRQRERSLKHCQRVGGSALVRKGAGKAGQHRYLQRGRSNLVGERCCPLIGSQAPIQMPS